MGTQIDRLVDEHFKELKKRCSLTALDENAKKVEKRKSLDCNLLSLAEPRSWDLKSVKVLVERTKFNEMQVVDSARNAQSPVKIPNGTALHKTPLKRRPFAKKKPAPAVPAQRPSIDEHFRTRRCYVKVPKDKQLIKLLHTEPVVEEQKRSRGRPKKLKKVNTASEESSAAPNPITTEHEGSTQSASNDLKRKHTETPDAAAQSKRSRRNKTSEFFISIDSLICSPSPRRKCTKVNSPEETKRRHKKPSALFSLVTLRHKFGKRFFKSYVKVKRHREQERPAVSEIPAEGEIKKRKKGKNLSVSFLETVEIFGESSDGEDWLDYDEPSFSGKATRLKPIDDGALMDNEFAKCSVTSTPCSASRTSENADKSASSATKPDGNPKRKEKSSFSPLKEDDASPRKEQLKLANEKIVRLSFEEQPAEEDEPESVSPSSRAHAGQSELTETAEDTDTDTAAGAEEKQDEEQADGERQEAPKDVNASEDPEPVALETELITPPPSDDKTDENAETVAPDAEATAAEKDTVAEEERGEDVKEDEQENLENKTNLEEYTKEAHNTSDEISRILSDDKECADSFESAVDVPIVDENSAKTQAAAEDDDLGVIANGVDKETVDLAELIEEHRKGSPISADEVNSRTEVDLPVAGLEHDDDLISETSNQVNISNSSDQQFEDASELIATVPLTEPLCADPTEVDAVLNDVCQLVVEETNTLLPPVHNEDEFVSPHNVSTVIDDDVDDFTSVLTHPEVERSLQSAASSTLVPNSQEIVVAAAVASQAAIVPPPDVDVTEDTFASVVAEVERFTKDVNPEIYSESVGITGDDVMMDNVQVRHSLDDIFDDDVDDDIISSLRMSSGSIDICHDKNLPIQVIETEVMAIPNEPDIIFDKPLGTTASILGCTSAHQSVGAEKN